MLNRVVCPVCDPTTPDDIRIDGGVVLSDLRAINVNAEELGGV